MPSFATVEAEIRCPRCGSLDSALVGFQWGYCWVPAGASVAIYRVGEPLLWRVESNGTVPPWSYFVGQPGGGNIGDPAFADLLIREEELFSQNCPSCNQYPLGDVRVLIRGGIIREVRVFEEGLPECYVSLIGDRGELVPKPEWDDCPMNLIDGGPSTHLVPHTALLTP